MNTTLKRSLVLDCWPLPCHARFTVVDFGHEMHEPEPTTAPRVRRRSARCDGGPHSPACANESFRSSRETRRNLTRRQLPGDAGNGFRSMAARHHKARHGMGHRASYLTQLAGWLARCPQQEPWHPAPPRARSLAARTPRATEPPAEARARARTGRPPGQNHAASCAQVRTAAAARAGGRISRGECARTRGGEGGGGRGARWEGGLVARAQGRRATRPRGAARVQAVEGRRGAARRRTRATARAPQRASFAPNPRHAHHDPDHRCAQRTARRAMLPQVPAASHPNARGVVKVAAACRVVARLAPLRPPGGSRSPTGVRV